MHKQILEALSEISITSFDCLFIIAREFACQCVLQRARHLWWQPTWPVQASVNKSPLWLQRQE